jgi:uncharacterized protein (DUF697 family)
MAFTKLQKVQAVIHSASVTAAGIGAGMAQIPASDLVVITPLQVGMITGIALVHERKLTEATATAILGTFAAGMFGRAISQALVGWVPGAGNALNAATAAGLTEAIGWSAHKFFEQLGNEHLSDAEIIARLQAEAMGTSKEREAQAKFLRAKGLLGGDAEILAFYNNALISPLFDDDHTNTCMFVTRSFVVQVKDSRRDCFVKIEDVQTVTMEHNSIFSDDYVVIVGKGGTVHKFVVIREEIGRGMKALIESLMAQARKR